MWHAVIYVACTHSCVFWNMMLNAVNAQ